MRVYSVELAIRSVRHVRINVEARNRLHACGRAMDLAKPGALQVEHREYLTHNGEVKPGGVHPTATVARDGVAGVPYVEPSELFPGASDAPESDPGPGGIQSYRRAEKARQRREGG